MSNKRSFNQAEILLLDRRIGQTFKDRAWELFISTANELGFKVRVTGGAFLTHEINATEEELIQIMLLTKGLI